jgi:dihydroxyacetone kinase-like protein
MNNILKDKDNFGPGGESRRPEMKKLINSVDTLLAEGLEGLETAHGDILAVNYDPIFVRRKLIRPDKVALISGGGSGHEPLHTGYVGYGMLDGACPGQVFTSPTPDQMIACAEAIGSRAGTLFIVKNYAGDSMNFQMASEMLERENAIAMVDDDVAVTNSTYTAGRRGVAGTVIVEKVVGAAAEAGYDLQACQEIAQKVNKSCATMGVALTSCTVPAAGRPTFDIAADQIEMGVGIHGEPGRRRDRLQPVDDLVEELADAILQDLEPAPGSEILLLVNGFGATPLMELHVVLKSAARRFRAEGLQIARVLVGNYTTALDMAGASVTVCVLDPTLKQLWDAPVHTAALRWGM